MFAVQSESCEASGTARATDLVDASVPPPWIPGTVFGGYRIVQHIRDGGMARIYAAARVSGRPVALKIPIGRFAADPLGYRRFIAEAELARALLHPNLVPAYDAGIVDGLPFYAMELVPSINVAALNNALRSRARILSPQVAAHIVMRAADGLHAAHTLTRIGRDRVSVVHCDVSPGNILLSTMGRVRVIDFGIAIQPERPGPDGSGARLLRGKPAYMAPEQALGKSVDARSDVFSLALVLWELIVGTRLFEGNHDLAVYQKANAPIIRDPAVVLGRGSLPLDSVLMKALAKDPDDRFSDMNAFRRAIDVACEGASGVPSRAIVEIVHAYSGSALESSVRIMESLWTLPRRSRADEPTRKVGVSPSYHPESSTWSIKRGSIPLPSVHAVAAPAVARRVFPPPATRD